MFNLFLIISFSLSLIVYANSARILGAVFTPSYSHQLAFRPIWKELAKRGHQITVLTTNPMNDTTLTNLKEIDLSFSYDIMKAHKTDEILSSNERGKLDRLKAYMNALHNVADAQLDHFEVKKLIQNQHEDFDLLMVEVTYPTQMAFAARFNIPFIGLMSLDAPPRLHAAIGNPTHPILYPDAILPMFAELTFKERIASTIFYAIMYIYSNYVLYPREDVTIRKHFGEHMPPLTDIQNDISMLFINVNPIFQNIRPVGPTTIQIGGGLHLTETPQPLPIDIKQFLDNAKEGFIYFSLGTNVKSASLSPQLKSVILTGLSKLPYKILWKFEDENLPNKPDNVKILKWVPQLAVLAHPNIKAFITQCGLQSIEEAIFNHVPMIGMPFYGDQGNNARTMEVRGLGISLNYATLTVDEFINSVTQVITNSEYKLRLKETAELAQDQQMSGLEKAVWWTEYVIRHKGAKHLKNGSSELPLYQYFLLDVISFLLLIIYLTIKIFKIILKGLCNILFRRNKKKRE